MDKIKLSIVSTLYKSEKTVEEFIERIGRAAKNLVGDEFEIILVNDGYEDKSVELALNMSKKIRNIKIIALSRNFGHHKALMAGLSYSIGEKVFLIDSDLEEEPELLESFEEKLKRTNADVVYGVQSSRKGGIFEKYSGAIYFKLFKFITNLNYPENVLTARLMKRKYVNALLMYKEAELYLIGIWELTGFSQVAVRAEKQSLSPTSYTIKNKLSLVINSIASFTDRPLKAIFYTGLFLIGIVIAYSFHLIIRYFLYGNFITGWTSVILSIWFFGGITISILGIMGIYLSKIFIETKNRPFLIVKDTYIDGVKSPLIANIQMNRW